MKETPPMGMNRTGIQMSPFDSTKMQSASPAAPAAPLSEDTAYSAVRNAYISAADPIGSVPLPGSATGMVTSGIEAITGNNPKIFIDKLGERLAFERTGTRMYDAFIAKFEAASEQNTTSMTLADLQRLRGDEARHFGLLVQAIDTLGADPTAETPAADLAGVESLGLVKVVSDPRTTLTQSLHAILIGELADNAGWDLLIALAREQHQSAMADDFTAALQEEQEHLQLIQRWYQEAILGEPLESPRDIVPSVRH